MCRRMYIRCFGCYAGRSDNKAGRILSMSDFVTCASRIAGVMLWLIKKYTGTPGKCLRA